MGMDGADRVPLASQTVPTRFRVARSGRRILMSGVPRSADHRTARRLRLSAGGLIVSLASVTVAVLPAQVAGAAVGITYYVNSSTDTGATDCATKTNTDCGIDDAIAAFDADTIPNDADTVVFSASITTLTVGTPTAIDNTTSGVTLAVDGNGPSTTAVSGDGGMFSVFTVDSGVTATISGLTIEDGQYAQVTNGLGYGGGIHNSGTLALANSTVSGNTSFDDSPGGQGGGIYNANGGTLTVTNSAISGNSAIGYSEGQGGGIYNTNGGILMLTDSTVSDNTATCAAVNPTYGACPAGGGGLFNNGTAIVTNSTLSGNIDNGPGYGAAIAVGGGMLTATSDTVSGNNGNAQVAVINPGTLSMSATIVANNPGGPDCYVTGRLTEGDYNLADDTSCGFSTSPPFYDLPQTLAGLDLAGLQNNGGLTQTIALEPGSRAIGTDASLCSTSDQRGVPRPTTNCDIGAVQLTAIVSSATNSLCINPSGVTSISTPTPSPSLTSYSNPPSTGGTCKPPNALKTRTHPVVVTKPPSSYGTPLPGSSWVGIAANASDNKKRPHPTAYYIYDTEFSMPPCFSAPSVSGSMMGENAVGVYLNNSFIAQAPNPAYGSPTLFSASNPTLFQAGTNVLDFVVANTRPSNATGLDFSATVAFLPSLAPSCVGTLKICKVAGYGVTGGTFFPFNYTTASGSGTVTVPAGPAPGGYCVVVGTFSIGTYTVTEGSTTPPSYVTGITGLPPGTAAGATYTGTLNAGAVTEVTYTDQSVPLDETGYLEICKDVAGSPVAPPSVFVFTVDDTGGLVQTVDVPPGACSPAIEVAAGSEVVTETPVSGYTMSACSTIPAGRVSCNPSGNTATVTVDAGAVSAETILTVTNTTTTTVCDTKGTDAGNPTWTELFPVTNPPARHGDPIACDPTTGNVVLFGGAGPSGSEILNDTWLWNGTTWTQVDDTGDPGCTTTCTASPPVRAFATMVYDPTTGNVVLFGGQNGSGTLNDTWLWNGTTWTQVDDTGDPGCTTTCTASPPMRGYASIAYDLTTGDVVLFGGYQSGGVDLNDTWLWNGTTWTQVDDTGDPGCTTACTNSPSARFDATMAQATSSVVLFGGLSFALVAVQNDTWLWNGITWTQVDDTGDPGCTTTCTASPPVREDEAMAYDPTTGDVVLFGGIGNSVLSDTWLWNGITWTQVDDTGDPGCTTACTNSPSARYYVTMTYDPTTGDVVLFGGLGLGGNLSDTWVYSP